MILFPDQQAAWTGVQQSMEQHLFGSAPSLMSSLARSEWPKNAAQKSGVCPTLLVNSTETPPVKKNIAHCKLHSQKWKKVRKYHWWESCLLWRICLCIWPSGGDQQLPWTVGLAHLCGWVQSDQKTSFNKHCKQWVMEWMTNMGIEIIFNLPQSPGKPRKLHRHTL